MQNTAGGGECGRKQFSFRPPVSAFFWYFWHDSSINTKSYRSIHVKKKLKTQNYVSILAKNINRVMFSYLSGEHNCNKSHEFVL